MTKQEILLKSWYKMELNSSYGQPYGLPFYDKNTMLEITEVGKNKLKILKDFMDRNM